VTPQEAPDLIFARHPLSYTYDTIVVPKHSKWKYKSPASLNSLTLGVIKGRKYDAIINKHIATYKDDNRKVQFAEGKYAGKENLKKLRYEKITALVDNQHKLQYFYHKRKKLFPFKVAKKLSYLPMKIAFSPKDYKAQRRARAFSYELNKLRGSKQMDMILKKYGLIEQNIQPPAEKR
jgi:ABC-type amino acid transport substrate-binding protein